MGLAPDTRKTIITLSIGTVATALAYLATSGALFWVAPGWQIGVFAGAVFGLVAGSVVQAAVGAPLTVALVALFVPPWYVELLGRGVGAGEAAVLALSALAAALGVSWLRLRSGLPGARAVAWVSAALLAMVVANMWITTLTVDTLSLAQNGTQLVADLERELRPMEYTSDAESYLRMLQLMRQGTPYYEAVRQSWLEKRGTESLPWGVVSYRLPTVFWMWRALPAGGVPLIVAFLVFSTVAIVAAWAIPAQVGLMRLAPVAAALVAANYLVISVSMFITYVDPWGMAFTLSGVALLIAGHQRGSRTLTWASAACFLVGALFREVLVYAPVAVAAAAVLMPRGRRIKAATPWLACFAAFVLAYAAHVAAVGGQVAPTPLAETWTRGSVAALVAAVNLGQELMTGVPWVLPFALALGIAGAFGLWRVADRQVAAAVLACATLPLLGLVVFGNPGTAPGAGMVNYWGMLFIPLNLALVPLPVLFLRPRGPATGGTRPQSTPSRKRR